jgi:chitinase
MTAEPIVRSAFSVKRHATVALLIVGVAVWGAAFIRFPSARGAQPAEPNGSAPWSIGYLWPFGDPSLPVSDIQWVGLTHLVQYGAIVNADGSLDLSTEHISSNADSLVSRGHAAGVKVLLALIQASWTGQTTTFEQAVFHHRLAFIKRVVDVVNHYGYDGVSVDSEPVSASALNLLAAELRSALGGRLLLAAAPVDQAETFRPIQGSFDRISIMTYDLTGAGHSYSWHNAALYSSDNSVWSVDLAVKRFLAAGLPAAKLDIGIPFYGLRLTGGGLDGPRQHATATVSVESISYRDIVSEITPQTYHWDAVAQVPYLSIRAGPDRPKQFVTYDNEQSVAAKINYVNDHKLGGWIIWHLQADYIPDAVSKHPLLTAIEKGRRANSDR